MTRPACTPILAGRLQGVDAADQAQQDSLVQQNLELVQQLQSVTAAFEALQVGAACMLIASAAPARVGYKPG